MSAEHQTVAVILAGGSGSRLGATVPKQLLLVDGKPIMEHALAAFQKSPGIDEIMLMMNPDYIEAAQQIAAGYSKVSQILPGGTDRDDSTKIALDALAGRDKTDRLLFHDAARPLVTVEIIENTIAALDHYEAVCVSISAVDTIFKTNDNNEIAGVLERQHLRQAQTPQGFSYETIARAYELAWNDPDYLGTDNCSVVAKYLPDIPIGIVEGSQSNIKVTREIDIHLAQTLLQLNHSTAVEI